MSQDQLEGKADSGFVCMFRLCNLQVRIYNNTNKQQGDRSH
jgi:hypothetical protein